MKTVPLKSSIVDSAVRDRNINRLRERGTVLPTFSELADPATIPAGIKEDLTAVDPDAPHPLNAQFTLERFAQGRMIDEKGMGPVPWMH